jgi:uncharacterized membrane protein YbhN (UPF0104 family)
MTPSWSRRALGALVGVAALLLPLVIVPRVAHTSWGAVAGDLTHLALWQVAALAAVWLAGLYVHTFVSTGALPGLTHRRAMALNFSGSAVSHLSPFGGVLGVAVNYTMVQSWGFDGANFTVLVLLTNACSVVTRLLLPTVALTLLVTLDLHTPSALIAPVFVGLGALVTFATATYLALRTRSDAVPSRPSRANALLGRVFGSGVVGTRDRVQTDLRAIVRRSWLRMGLAMTGYALLQATLLWLCLLAVGAHLSPVGTIAAYAVGSALSLIPFTPGGVGFAEAGTAAVLFGIGGSPASVAAGVILYSAFTRWMEIPVGAATTAWWWTQHKVWRRPIPPIGVEPSAVADEAIDLAYAAADPGG